jgi:hypothetical protein
MGYNIALQLGSKTCLGRTQEDLSVTPTVKESITKDNQGTKQYAVTGQEVTFKVSGLITFDSATGTTTTLDGDDLMDQSLKTGSAAEISAVYYRGTNGASYQGTVIMTGYSESSNSEDEATYTADFKVTGSFTKVTNQSNL